MIKIYFVVAENVYLRGPAGFFHFVKNVTYQGNYEWISTKKSKVGGKNVGTKSFLIDFFLSDKHIFHSDFL